MSKPRILIADDHPILAEGLRGLLEPEFEVIGVVADGRELVAAAKKQAPDVIIADVAMPRRPAAIDTISLFIAYPFPNIAPPEGAD